MEASSILLAGLDVAVETALRNALRHGRFVVLPETADVRDDATAGAQLAVVGLDSEGSFAVVSRLTAAGLHVVVVGPDKDPDRILRAMREGAREYLMSSELDALVQVVREQARPRRAAGLGSVVTVFPAKGGVGATTVATNLAGALARTGQRVCLVDLDLAMGDVLAFLDLAGTYAISDVVDNLQRIDRDLLEASVVRHRSGIDVLAQTDKFQEAPRLTPRDLESLIEFLRQHYTAVVLDGLRTFDDHAVAALEVSDRVLLLVTQEVPAVRRAQRCASFLKRLGHDGERLRLVVNRWSKSAEVKDALVAETVGAPIAATIASDYPALVRAINRGSLLLDEAPRSAAARDLDALRTVAGFEPPAAAPTSLLKRLFAPRVAHAH